MSLQYLLAAVICKTFEKNCGKWQSKKEEPRAFVVKFSIPIAYEKEDGYRHLDLALYAECNYVDVYTRERWDVIPLSDIDDASKDYTRGNSGWKFVGSHDSCWRSMVEDFIRENASRLNTFDCRDDFYELVNPSELPDKS